MAAYAVALFCFTLVLCSARGLPCPGRSCVHKARILFGIQFGILAGIGSGLGILLTLCRGYTGLCTGHYARLYAAFMLLDCAKFVFLFGVSHF